MLFYTQIKREFTHASWRRGQLYFRDERVSDVALEGDVIRGKIQGTDKAPYEAAIKMARGTIQDSKCSCPAHRQYERHCKHVAALAIWTVERGSLLRSGVKRGGLGVSAAPGRPVSGNDVMFPDVQRAMTDNRLRKLISAHPFLGGARFAIRRDLMAATLVGVDRSGYAFSIPVTLEEAAALTEHTDSVEKVEERPNVVGGEPVLYVRGLFQSKVLNALTVESGVRYFDPISKSVQINTLTYLSASDEPGLWKTTQGLLVQVTPPNEIPDNEASFIQKLQTPKIIYQGQSALENLAKLLTHKHRDQMVFDPAVDVRVETVPLKLTTLTIGEKGEKTRKLIYEFEGGGMRLTSNELDELSKFGKLSNQYVWKGDRIYRFETSLGELYQYSNRSGIAASEEDEGTPTRVAGHGALYDDGETPLHPLAAYRLSLELGVTNLNVDPTWGDFHEWKKTFEKTKIAALPKVEYGFKLRGYQKNGLSWMWSLYHRGLASLLADEMGLGKTHQVLAFLTSIYKGSKPKVKNPSLVVAPTSVISAWKQKLQKYDTGLKWVIFHGSGRKLPATGVDLVLTTYGILHREAMLRDKDWHVVILDEAQAIKNAGTISSRASRALKARFRIAMTGTPIENQSADLWSLMEFLLPGYLGSLARFKRLYGWGRDTPPEAQAASLKRLVSPFLLRRTKAQVLKELPEKTEEIIRVEMTPVQRKAYRECLTGADAQKARDDLKSGGKVDYANILALLTRLKQICDHPKLPSVSSGRIKGVSKLNVADTGKWEAFEELLDEALRSDLKVVVFTQYLGMMDMIGRYLEGREIGFTDLRGDTTDRGGRLDRFQNDPECKVFVCSLLAGGLGIDLTAASVCIHFDRWWNPAKENQATDRLHRYGQTRGVQVFKLQIPETVEDRISQIIESKVALSGALIEESSVGLKTFSRKDLLELLNPKAIAKEDPDWDF